MTAGKPLLGLVTSVATLVVLANPASAWKYVEHTAIGTKGYKQACKSIESRLPAQQDPTSLAIRDRFEIACGNLAVRAALYGQASALAGDRLNNPEDFLARGGDWKVGSRKHYFLLQLVDVHHFHPSSMHEWVKHHRAALQFAEAAAREQGIDAIDAFQRAFFRNAFGDHFLQDSHAAGHMGFNRSASSIAATAAYHKVWNKRGRRLENRKGERWTTYGDGLLHAKKNTEGKRRVVEACENSAYAVVFGARDTSHELAAWRQLPLLIDARPMASLLEGESEEEEVGLAKNLRPLQAVSWPARVDKVVDLTLQLYAPISDAKELTSATMLGFDTILPLVETRVHLSFGATTPTQELAVHPAVQLEFRKPIGLSIDGLLHHQIAASFLWEARTQKFSGWASLAYSLQAEMGINLFKLQAGPTFDVDRRDFGYHVGLSYGRVFGVAGGGVR